MTHNLPKQQDIFTSDQEDAPVNIRIYVFDENALEGILQNEVCWEEKTRLKRQLSMRLIQGLPNWSQLLSTPMSFLPSRSTSISFSNVPKKISISHAVHTNDLIDGNIQGMSIGLLTIRQIKKLGCSSEHLAELNKAKISSNVFSLPAAEAEPVHQSLVAHDLVLMLVLILVGKDSPLICCNVIPVAL